LEYAFQLPSSTTLEPANGISKRRIDAKAPLIVLLVSLLIFRGLGALGVNVLSSWPTATRYGLALMFLFTASSYFTKMKQEVIQMVPETLPYPRQLSWTGLCEVLGGAAVNPLCPKARRDGSDSPPDCDVAGQRQCRAQATDARRTARHAAVAETSPAIAVHRLTLVVDPVSTLRLEVLTSAQGIPRLRSNKARAFKIR
jgi:hypothetical protein